MSSLKFLIENSSVEILEQKISILEELIRFGSHVCLPKHPEKDEEATRGLRQLSLCLAEMYLQQAKRLRAFKVTAPKDEKSLNGVLPSELADLFASICIQEDHFNLILPVDFYSEFQATLESKGIKVSCAKEFKQDLTSDSLSLMMQMARYNYDRAVSQFICLQVVFCLTGFFSSTDERTCLITKALKTISNFKMTLLTSSSLVALADSYMPHEILQAKENVAMCAKSVFGHPDRYVKLALMHHLTPDGYSPGRYLTEDERKLEAAIAAALKKI